MVTLPNPSTEQPESAREASSNQNSENDALNAIKTIIEILNDFYTLRVKEKASAPPSTGASAQSQVPASTGDRPSRRHQGRDALRNTGELSAASNAPESPSEVSQLGFVDAFQTLLELGRGFQSRKQPDPGSLMTIDTARRDDLKDLQPVSLTKEQLEFYRERVPLLTDLGIDGDNFENTKMWDAMIQGDPYYWYDCRILSIEEYWEKRMEFFNRERDDFKRAKMIEHLFSPLDQKLAKPMTIQIDAPLFINFPKNLFLGNNVRIQANSRIWSSAKVCIGDSTQCDGAVSLITEVTANMWNGYERRSIEAARTNVQVALPISIGKNCKLGAGVTICAGVTIGDGTVILDGCYIGMRSVIGSGVLLKPKCTIKAQRDGSGTSVGDGRVVNEGEIVG